MLKRHMKPRRLPQLSKKQWIGFACIYLAGLGWLADIIIPFTKLSNKHIYFAVALGVAEVSFVLGVALLGRTFYRQIKAKYLARFKSSFKERD
jgi:hypothetical protein